MTVIAFDGKTLAADKLCCNGSARATVTKIARSRRMEGALLAITGDLSIGREMVDWFEDGARASQYPPTNRDPEKGASLIVIHGDGAVWRYESSPSPFQLDGKFHAFGIGQESANVAMHCGKSAREAVEIACLYTTGCGNGVDTLTLGAWP